MVGLGAMGSMATWRLAARGARVVGIDALAPPHDRGSSHGESRITRTAYFEGPWYVPLLQESHALWRELERETGADLLTMNGATMIGRQESQVVAGALASARLHRLEHTLLTGAAAAAHCPQHRLAEDEVVLVEAAAGFLRPERCVAAALRRAAELGADLRSASPVGAVHRRGAGWVCETVTGVVAARHLVVATGAAIGSLVPALAGRLRVQRQVLGWFAVDEPALFAPERFPVFCHDQPGEEMAYGFPTLDGRTIKLAFHGGGPEVDPLAPVPPVSGGELDGVAAFVATRLRGVLPAVERAVACRYTVTPDEHFVVDRVDGAVAVSACSGHGFKFSCVLGDVVADLVLEGTTRRDISRFALGRLLR